MIVSAAFSTPLGRVRRQFKRPTFFLIGVSAIAISTGLSAQQDSLPFNERPAVGTVTISNSSLYDGTFALSTIARVCGEVPAELNFGGVPTFIVQFYSETGTDPLEDISFHSQELVGGVTTSSTFFLSVVVKSPSIGSPPAYVLDTSRPGTSGSALLTVPEPGTQELTIDGVNDMGEKILLSLKCGPRA